MNVQNNHVETEMPGDVNNDGIVDVLDLVQIVNFILDQGSLEVESAGDFNNDGIIDILDIIIMVNLVLIQ